MWVVAAGGHLEVKRYRGGCNTARASTKYARIASHSSVRIPLSTARSLRVLYTWIPPTAPLPPWNKLTCELAAFNGRLQVLKWAREHDCPWDEVVCER